MKKKVACQGKTPTTFLFYEATSWVLSCIVVLKKPRYVEKYLALSVNLGVFCQCCLITYL
jgi:hypothetical protein